MGVCKDYISRQKAFRLIMNSDYIDDFLDGRKGKEIENIIQRMGFKQLDDLLKRSKNDVKKFLDLLRSEKVESYHRKKIITYSKEYHI